MSGKYLRKRVPGQPQDPTMTYVDDPRTFKSGDIIRDAYGYDLIASIDEAMFGDPDIRFVHLREVTEAWAGLTIVHDVR